MRPHDDDLDEEIRGHLALSIKERVDRGEDPESARLAALRDLGYIPAIRDEMRRVWYSRWYDAATALALEIRVALRSLLRTKGLAATVVVTLALGIGANAAIFSVVRGVLLRPLTNRGEDRLVYIRQRAPGIGAENMTFSVPEIADIRSRVTTIDALGEFSTIEFTLLGFGDPRVVRAGVVSGSYFDVMGLRPVLGRLLTPADDGPNAQGAAVLTHRFWTTALNADPAVIGKRITLGARSATVVGVLEPSVPYPADTEIIANVVTSPHHLGATMVTQRTHRMTELFGRLAPGATIDAARSELTTIHDTLKSAHPESYPKTADVQLRVTRLREQITAPARTILLVLLGVAAVVFVIACSNVANLILARSVRREGELAVRAALGASHRALRRTLLAESLVLCCGGAALGMLIARPLMTLVAQFASRFSVRALEVTVDATLLWVGAGLAIGAAVLLAYIPRLPSPQAPTGLALTSGSLRITPGTNRRLRAFAVTQIAFSFVLLAGATTLVSALVALQTAPTAFNLHQVLAIDLPSPSLGESTAEERALYAEAVRRISAMPGVRGVALGTVVPWRDAGAYGAGFQFAAEGYTPANGEELPHGRFRVVSPGFFSVLGVPLLAGRDFTNEDRRTSPPVVIVSSSVVQRLFPSGEALNRHIWWTDPYFGKPVPRRIVGVVADVDDENIVPGPALTIYHPFQQIGIAGRLFVHAEGDPYALVPAVTRAVREMAPNQPIERPATLQDVRAEVLAPDRLNAFVVSGFAGVALLIAVVGVAGVLAFSVGARTRELGVRLAIGSTPRALLMRVLWEGLLIVLSGVAAGVLAGYAFAAIAGTHVSDIRLPSPAPLAAAAALVTTCAVLASLMPALRAARVDVLQALRSE
jgi:putative ABC transport system permease protein